MARIKSFSKSGILNVVFQVVFLLILYFVGNKTYLGMEGAGRNVVLLIIVMIPSAIWTLFFYFQDRIEPEPASYVIVSFLAGMAGAALLTQPLEKSIYGIGEWLYQSSLTLIIGSIFITGVVASFLFYLVIRYGFYGTKEFDEPVDGMVYGAFIGSGFALIKSLTYLSAHPEFTLFSIAYTATTNILIYASVGSLIGFIIGRVKFLKKSAQTASILAILVGMVLIGLYHILNEFVFVAGLEGAIWISFILTLVFAVAILIFVYSRMRRLTAKPLHKKIKVEIRPDFLVFLLVLIFLVVGGVTKIVANQDAYFEDDKYGIAFKYNPRAFSVRPSSGLSSISSEAVTFSTTVFSAIGEDEGEYIFTVKVKEESVDPKEINILRYTGDIETISFYAEESDIGGKRGVHLRYSLVDKSQLSTKEFPDIYWICTDILPSEKYTYIFTFEATPQNFDKTVKLYEDILRTITWINQ